MPALPTNCGCLRGLVAQAAIILAGYWCVVAIYQFPWIVGPDFDPAYEAGAVRASAAGLWMAVVSGATFCFAIGLFHIGRRSWWAAVALVVCAAVAVPSLFPDRDLVGGPKGGLPALL